MLWYCIYIIAVFHRQGMLLWSCSIISLGNLFITNFFAHYLYLHMFHKLYPFPRRSIQKCRHYAVKESRQGIGLFGFQFYALLF